MLVTKTLFGRRPGMDHSRRRGFSLLEVLTALAIFLFSLIGLSQLLTHASDRAIDAHQVGQATLLAQGKLAEVVAGAIPLTSQGNASFDEDSDYQWSLDCDAASIPGLWNVQVKVSRANSDGKRALCTLSQMVLDPAQRGSTADTPTSSGTTPGSANSSQPAAASISPSGN